YRSGQGGLVASRHFRPVDDVIEGGNVIGTPILILEVIGMLPDVEPQYGRVARHEGAVLVARAFNDKLFIGGYAQPGPAAAETRQGCLGKSLFELIQAAKIGIDGG